MYPMYPQPQNGACRTLCPNFSKIGCCVPFRSQAIIRLLIKDCQSSYVGTLPFLIDTGTTTTVIPRGKVAENAFPSRNKSKRPIPPLGFGEPFDVTLQILNPLINFGNPIESWKLEVLVVDAPLPFGLLGRNALKRVIMVTDDQLISLWPLDIDSYNCPNANMPGKASS